ncbi:hypothetical protein [Solitalea koreensis]|uniref:Uncharacterized protein n=1 Tax=Solitalea koreensis TaxID=543615 RepID=A0A521DSE8_9SPHI|nr:hypothetical protein [Solitalea koreensis]SMO74627.1 hypothetical protein SAMN06265350_10892 [Solitalea koreensis]
MEATQKLELMDKILRELDDLKNSETAVVQKIAKLEIDNMTLSDKMLDTKLSDIYSEAINMVDHINETQTEFDLKRNKFEQENNLAQKPAE